MGKELFLSHAWGDDAQGRDAHAMVKRVAAALAETDGDGDGDGDGKRWTSYVDEQDMVGDIVDSMSAGIDAAELVIVFVTQKYMDKANGDGPNGTNDNVYREFKYATARKKKERMVAVVLEPLLLAQRNWTGAFSMCFGEELYVDFTGDDEAAAVRSLRGMLGKKLRALAAIAALPTRAMAGSAMAGSAGASAAHDLFSVSFDPFTAATYKANDFVPGTREWIISAVNDWYHAKEPWTRVFVLLGCAGVGKSVILAQLCRVSGALPARPELAAGASEAGENSNSGPAGRKASKRWSLGKAKSALARMSSSRRVSKGSGSGSGSGSNGGGSDMVVGALHFFKHDDARTSDPRQCLLSIANQLAKVVPGLHATMVASGVEAATRAEGDLRTLFRMVLSEPCGAVPPPPRRVVIVMDALDECATAERLVLLDILQQLWLTETPGWLGLVISSRPEEYIPHKLQRFNPTELNTEDANNTSDLQAYLTMRLAPLLKEPRQLGEAVAVVLERSEGLFLYARFLEDILESHEGGKLTLADIKNTTVFPTGLDGVYTVYFERFKKSACDGDDDVYLGILGPLVAARAPLPVSVVQDVLASSGAGMHGHGDGDGDGNGNGNGTSASAVGLAKKARERVAKATQLIYVVNDEMRFVHKSMVDWLTAESTQDAEAELAVDVADGHAVLGDWACARALPSASASAPAPASASASGATGRARGRGRGRGRGRVRKADAAKQARDDETAAAFLHKHALFHLGSAEMLEEASALLLDLDWLHTGFKQRLVAAHDVFVDGQRYVLPGLAELAGSSGSEDRADVSLVVRAIEKSAAALDHDPDELFSQLLGRLPYRHPTIAALVAKQGGGRKTLPQLADKEWLRPVRSSLEQAGSPLRKTLRGHTKGAPKIAAYGNRLATGGGDGVVKSWDVETGQMLFSVDLVKADIISRRSGGVWCLAANADWVGVGLWDSTVRLISTATGRFAGVVVENEVVVRVLCFSDRGPDEEELLITGGADNTVRIFGMSKVLENVVPLLHRLERGHEVEIWSIATRGDVLVTGSQTLIVWSLSKHALRKNLTGHPSYVFDLLFDDDDPDVVYSASADGTAKAWGLSTRGTTALGTFAGPDAEHWGAETAVRNLAQLGRRLFTVGDMREVNIFDKDTRELLVRFPSQHADSIRYCLVMPDTGHLITSSDDETIKVFEAGKMEAWAGRSRKAGALQGHSQYVHAVKIDAANDRAFSVSNDRTVRVWSLATGEVQHAFGNATGQHISGIYSIALSDALGLIATGHGAHHPNPDKIRLWDKTSMEHVGELAGHVKDVHAMVFHGEDTLVSGSEDGTVRVWSVSRREELLCMEHGAPVNGVAVSANGKLVVSGGSDGLVKAWQMDSGKSYYRTTMEHRRVQGSHATGMSSTQYKKVRGVSLTFEGGKEVIVSVGYDDMRRVWCLSTQVQIRAEPIPRAARSAARTAIEHAEVECDRFNCNLDPSKAVKPAKGVAGGVGFTADAVFSYADVSDHHVVLGDRTGQVHILRREKPL